jgi:hypothetical protein
MLPLTTVPQFAHDCVKNLTHSYRHHESHATTRPERIREESRKVEEEGSQLWYVPPTRPPEASFTSISERQTLNFTGLVTRNPLSIYRANPSASTTTFPPTNFPPTSQPSTRQHFQHFHHPFQPSSTSPTTLSTFH